VARQFRITDQSLTLVIDDVGPGPVPAIVTITRYPESDAEDGFRLSREDVRFLISVLESLGG
jgi:hypothetical protein